MHHIVLKKKNPHLFNFNQVIQLPRNSISLYGNQSTDDHDSLSYEWSLSPESKDKVVEMQVGPPGTTHPSVSAAHVMSG